MTIFDPKKFIDEMLLQQAVYYKQKNINMPKILEERLNKASVEEKAEAEIALVNAEYLIDKICAENNGGLFNNFRIK